MNRCLTALLLAALCFVAAPSTAVAQQKCDNPFDIMPPEGWDYLDLVIFLTSPPPVEMNPFNINGDDQLSTADLLIVLSLYGTPACEADVNGDGIVDTIDVQLFVLMIY